MITFQINGKNIGMTKFFSTKDVDVAKALIGNAKRVLFVDTPSTEHLANLIEELVGDGVEVIVRDHHDMLIPQTDREEQIRKAAARTRSVASDAIISDRANHPACSLLIEAGEFADVDVVIADPDPDGLTATMKALGIDYPELDADAAVLDGPPALRIAENLSQLALLLSKGLATVPPYNKDRPHISENAKANLFSQFVTAVQGMVALKELEERVEAFEKMVAKAEELVGNATKPVEGLLVVEAGNARFDLGAFGRLTAQTGAKVTVVVKTTGPLAQKFGKQYSLAVVKAFQDEINLQKLLPEGFKSSIDAGILSNVEFLLHVNEQVWTNTVLPELKKLLK